MDKITARKMLLEQRLNMHDRLERAELLQRVMRIWLVGRRETVIGAYWPIKAEFDPLPALYRWQEDAVLGPGYEAPATPNSDTQTANESSNRSPRKIGLPVVDKLHKTLIFHAWYPGCPMEEDAYSIPKPKHTDVITPTLLFVPCLGYGPSGLRLGYGGGFYDHTLASLQPRPFTVGLGYSHGGLPDLRAEPHDVPLDAILTDEGVAWHV